MDASSAVDLGGSSSLNLRVEGLVVRVHRPCVTPERLAAIHVARRALLAAGIPGTPVLDVGVVDGLLAEVEAFVAHDDSMRTPALLRQGWPWLRRVHEVLVDVPAGPAPAFANAISSSAALAATRRGAARLRRWGDDELADRAVELAERLAVLESSQPEQLVHGDFWDGNVLFRDGAVVLVGDLDFMGVRPVVDDVALTMYFAGTDDPSPYGELDEVPLRLALARQPLWSVGGWIADLDDERAARAHADGLLHDVERALSSLPPS